MHTVVEDINFSNKIISHINMSRTESIPMIDTHAVVWSSVMDDQQGTTKKEKQQLHLENAIPTYFAPLSFPITSCTLYQGMVLFF